MKQQSVTSSSSFIELVERNHKCEALALRLINAIPVDEILRYAMDMKCIVRRLVKEGNLNFTR